MAVKQNPLQIEENIPVFRIKGPDKLHCPQQTEFMSNYLECSSVQIQFKLIQPIHLRSNHLVRLTSKFHYNTIKFNCSVSISFSV